MGHERLRTQGTDMMQQLQLPHSALHERPLDRCEMLVDVGLEDRTDVRTHCRNRAQHFVGSRFGNRNGQRGVSHR